MTGKDNDWRGEASAFAADAACENCGAPCDYDSEVCLCRACEVASGQLTYLTGKDRNMAEELRRAEQVGHTPGPWSTGSTMTRVEVWLDGWRVPMVIADCHAKHAPESERERCANARLIAAAPDLLAACKAMRDRITELHNEKLCACWNDWPASYEIDAAIAKAEGTKNNPS